MTNHPYLGVELQGDLKWDKHIDNIVNKANQALGFLRRNIYMCPKEVKTSAYYTLVRPHLEYASAAWDPHMVKDTTKLESVQHKAARFVTGNREREEGCMTRLLQDLDLAPVAHRRKVHRLTILYMATQGDIAINIPDYVQHQSRHTRSHHQDRFIPLSTSSDIYKYSFFPRTIVEWNNLPPEIVTSNISIPAFKKAVSHGD